MENVTNPCRNEMKNAAVMSFCGPLQKVEMLGWAGEERPEVAVVTMLRHPVERGTQHHGRGKTFSSSWYHFVLEIV